MLLLAKLNGFELQLTFYSTMVPILDRFYFMRTTRVQKPLPNLLYYLGAHAILKFVITMSARLSLRVLLLLTTSILMTKLLTV